MFFFYKRLTCYSIFFQEEEYYQIKCCRCNAVLGSGSTEEKDHSSLQMELHDFTSINLHKHRISLRHSHLFRYSMLNLIWEEIYTESVRKLSKLNFLWTKTLFQNNLINSAFFFTFFKGYRCKFFWYKVFVYRKLKLLNFLVDYVLIFTLKKRDVLFRFGITHKFDEGVGGRRLIFTLLQF